MEGVPYQQPLTGHEAQYVRWGLLKVRPIGHAPRPVPPRAAGQRSRAYPTLLRVLRGPIRSPGGGGQTPEVRSPASYYPGTFRPHLSRALSPVPPAVTSLLAWSSLPVSGRRFPLCSCPLCWPAQRGAGVGRRSLRLPPGPRTRCSTSVWGPKGSLALLFVLHPRPPSSSRKALCTTGCGQG